MHELKKQFRSLTEATRANRYYQGAQQEWDAGRFRSAFRLMRRAAQTGLVDAMELLGQFYDSGTGIQRNTDNALVWYRRAAKKGRVTAANNIGCILRDRGSHTAAIRWFEKAIRLGDDEAHLNIAKLYLSRAGYESRAREHLRKVLRSSWTTQHGKREARRLISSMANGAAALRGQRLP